MAGLTARMAVARGINGRRVTWICLTSLVTRPASSRRRWSVVAGAQLHVPMRRHRMQVWVLGIGDHKPSTRFEERHPSWRRGRVVELCRRSHARTGRGRARQCCALPHRVRASRVLTWPYEVFR